MKNRILKISFVLVAIAGLTTLTACKKGENDPFLSLKSRKARISGEWKLSSGTITESDTYNGMTNTDVVTYTSSTYSSNGATFSYSETLTIDKNGTFESVVILDGDVTTIRGNWFFSGKVKEEDLKNKEAIVLSETQYIYSSGASTYTGLYADRILMIDQLKSKEMIFKGKMTYSETGGYAGSFEYDQTYEKQ